jgi:hypothetical protein
MSLKSRAILIALLAGGLAAGCDDAPPPKARDAAGPPASTPKEKVAVLPPQMVAAVSAGKSSAMISVHFVLGAVPAVGKPLPVDIAVVPHRPFDSVRALFEAPDSLHMAGNTFPHQTDAKAEDVFNHRLTLTPSEEGVFLVTAAVETEGADGSVTRIYSIPIIVHGASGSAKPSPSAAPAVSAPPAA